MLPLTIEMRDHLRQEKTGYRPSDLPPVPRQVAFRNGMLGLWSGNNCVIHHREGRVPQPGIVPSVYVQGDVSIFDRPGSVMIRVKRSKQTHARQKSHPFPMSPRIQAGDGYPLSDICIQAMDDYFGGAKRTCCFTATNAGGSITLMS